MEAKFNHLELKLDSSLAVYQKQQQQVSMVSKEVSEMKAMLGQLLKK